MVKRAINNVKLGIFVLAGLLFLVLLLYMIGKNRSLFGATYVLKARFENVQGLVAGNNVRYAGIEAGTVRRVTILNDTTIEVIMIIDDKMKDIIRKNAIVSIGTEGFVGNKVVNIVPVKQPAPLALENDILATRKAVDTDEMLQTLFRTNNDIATIASELKSTVQRVNNSDALWNLLNDNSIPQDLRSSIARIRVATTKAGDVTEKLDAIVADVKEGKGSAGMLLKDSSFAKNLNEAVMKIKTIGEETDSLVADINKVVTEIREDANSGKGPLNAVLKDSVMVAKLNASLDNIQKGTDGFNQNMEALKHNFLLRGYFRKQEKQRRRAEEKSTASDN